METNDDFRSERFKWQEGEASISQCAFCVHKHSGAGTCDAFPDGIPMEILTNDFDHRNEHPDDNGIQFEAKPGERHPGD